MSQDSTHGLSDVPGLRRFDIAKQKYPLMPLKEPKAGGGGGGGEGKGNKGKDGEPTPALDIVARDPLSATPRELIPSLGQYPTTPTWYYQTVAITDVSGEAPGDDPKQEPAGDAGAAPAAEGDKDPGPDVPEGAATGPTPVTEAFDPMTFAAATHGASVPAVGVLLKQAQTWTTAGLALGNLLHSVCLAPGEVTQVAIIDWERTESGSQQESIDASDAKSSSSNQSRSIQDVTSAVMRETQEGSSHARSDSVSTQGGVGGALAFFAGSASQGTNQTVTTAVTRSAGSRDVAAEANQNVNAATTRAAEQVRSRRASVVREVRQAEHEQITTRVVANYNHCHTLNIEYFEVVEVFELVTRVVSAERCIFLPMKIVDFVEDLKNDEKRVFGQRYCIRFRDTLVEAARLIGDPELAIAIEMLADGGKGKVVTNFEVGGDAKRTPYRDALAGQLKAATTAFDAASDHSKKADIECSRIVNEILEKSAQYESAYAAAHPGGVAGKQGDGGGRATDFGPLREKVDRISKELQGLRQEQLVAQKARRRARETAEAAKRKRDKIQSACDEYDRALAELRDVGVVGARLNAHQLYFSQAIWLSMGPAIIQEMVKGKTHQGETIADTIDPHPIAVDGNYLGFRWPFKERAEQEKLDKAHVKKDAPTASVAIPTGGVFAEGILGQAVSAEKIDSSLFWKWEEHDIPIKPTGIDNIKSGSRARKVDLSGSALEPSGISLPTLANLPDPAGLAGLYETIRDGSVFRDMSGSEVIKSLAEQSVRLSSEGAKDAAEQATKTLDTVLKHQAKVIETLAPLIADAMAKKAGGGAGGGKLPIKDPTKGDEGDSGESEEATAGAGGFLEA